MLLSLLLRHLIGLHDQAFQHGPLRYTVTAGKALQGAFGMQIDQQTQSFELSVLILQMPRSIVRLSLCIVPALGLDIGFGLGLYLGIRRHLCAPYSLRSNKRRCRFDLHDSLVIAQRGPLEINPVAAMHDTIQNGIGQCRVIHVSGFEHPHKYGLETAPWPMEGAEAVNE